MQRVNTVWLALFVLLSLPTGWAAGQTGTASIRVRCQDESVGAEVFFNGKFKGECPFDAAVPEGLLKIESRKALGKDRERVFKQELRIGAGTLKSIEIILGEEVLTAEGRRQEELAKADAGRQSAARLATLRTAADAGNGDAMAALAQAYDDGRHGLQRDWTQALNWFRKAANAGNAEAMFRVSSWPESDNEDVAVSQGWFRKAAQAGHSGAQEKINRLPRYCRARAVKGPSTVVDSPIYDELRSDGTQAPVKAALERFTAQLRLLQPGQWDRIQNGPTTRCEFTTTGGVSCITWPSSSELQLTMTCEKGTSFPGEYENMARKGRVVLPDWNGQ